MEVLTKEFNPSLNIMYDISVLGAGLYRKRARTGVARVIENLSQALLENTSVKVTFCARWSPLRCIQAIKYLQNEEHAKRRDFALPRNFMLRTLVRSMDKMYPAPGERPASRRIINGALRPLNMFTHNLPAQGLTEHDLFHSTFYPLPRRGKGNARGVRILTVYDVIPVLFPQYFGASERLFMRRLLASINRQDRILVISESTKSDLCDCASLDPEQVEVTYLAASGNFFPHTDEQRISEIRHNYKIPKGPYVLSLCTFEPRKNIDQTIRSYIELVKQQGVSDLNLVLVGTKGWDFDKIFNEIKGTMELHDRIITTGYVPDEDLAPLYSGAMMFAYPSFYEGFGLPPLEAMQCGVPVITSNTSSLPEVVGDAGIMVDPNDGDALSQAMLDLYRDDAKRVVFSAEGISRAKKFTWKKCADKTVEAYRTALDSQL